jgi:hypothetical protein
VVKRLPFGKTLEERSPELAGLPAGEGGVLTEQFPEIKRGGYLVETALAIQVEQDESARALVLHRPLEEGQRPFGPRPTWLGIASCTADRGYALAARPIELHDSSAVLVWDTERITLPGGATSTLVTLAMGGVALEFHAAAFLLGKGSQAFPVQDPKDEPWGLLGVFGNVAQQFLIPSPEESYARVDRAEGTGFYPMDGRSAFLALRVEQGQLRGVVQGWIGADGVKRPDSGPTVEAWAAVGKGEQPPFCTQVERVRCAGIKAPVSQGKLDHAWIAGLWPSAEAAGAALKALGADVKKLDFLLIGTDDADPPRGPGGKKALTFLKATPPKKRQR